MLHNNCRYTDIVRDKALMFEKFTYEDINNSIRLRVKNKNEKVRNSIRALRRTGEVKSIRRGLYQFCQIQKPLSLMEKMWRAMRIKEFFTCYDICKLTGASTNYVKQYVRYLKRKGFVSSAEDAGIQEGIYRLNDPEGAPLKHPAIPWKKRRNASCKS